MATTQSTPAPVKIPNAYDRFDPNNETHVAFRKLKAKYGFLYGHELAAKVQTMDNTADLVAGMLPARSVNVLAGDSGVGKTPLAYQLALAVATGTPFLGAATRPGKVMIADFENSEVEAQRILEQQRRHLGLPQYPKNSLLYWQIAEPIPLQEFELVVRMMAPELLIVDSLRSFCPWLEAGSVSATKHLHDLRVIAHRRDTTILMLHHVQKRNTRTMSTLEDTDALDWLNHASGSRAIINQTDVRLALAPARNRDRSSVVLRGHFRTRGEIGPWYLRRQFDEYGEVLGYQRIVATCFLDNPEHETAFVKLPDSFTFADARQVYGKGKESTNLFLHRLMQHGLLRKIARGEYVKCENAEQAGLSQ